MGDIIPTSSSSSSGTQAGQTTRSLGLSYHLADVWLPELRKVAGEGPLPPEGLAALLEPFVGVLQHGGEVALIHRVRWVCVGGGACGWGCCLCRRAGCVCGAMCAVVQQSKVSALGVKLRVLVGCFLAAVNAPFP